MDLELSRLAWIRGDAATALAAADSVLARQSDSPGGLRARASALALAARWDEAFAGVRRRRAPAHRHRGPALRLRLRPDPRRTDGPRRRRQLDEAKLLDEKDPTAEALRGLRVLADDPDAALMHARQALEWGPWSDLARIVLGAAQRDLGDTMEATAAWAPVRERIARDAPLEWIYRGDIATWVPTHQLPAVERTLLKELENR